MKEIIQLFLDWLERNIPTFLAGLSVGYGVMRGKFDDAQKQIVDLKLRLAHEENVKTVEANNAGKSDDDIVDDAISKGMVSGSSESKTEMPESSPNKGPGKP